jgi:hypothetical protein
MISRRAGNFMVAIVTLSVVHLKGLVGAIVWKLEGICMSSQSFLSISRPRFLQAKRTNEDQRTQRRTRETGPALPASFETAPPLRAGADL